MYALMLQLGRRQCVFFTEYEFEAILKLLVHLKGDAFNGLIL